jgi:hypothetical protein
LEPFIVTSWHGAGEGDMPDDVREVFRASGLSGTNVYAILLDPDGKLVHGFRAIPEGRNPDLFQEEIRKAKLPEVKAPELKLHLPDGDGVRIFLRMKSDQSAFTGTPLVEFEKADWSLFAMPDEPREIDAEKLRGWLRHLYPPAIRTADQKKPFKTCTGKLKLRKIDAKTAHLGGEFRLTKGDEGESAFEGSLGMVITYRDGKPSLRGTIDGVYLYRLRETQRMRMAAAIESRPD